MNLTGLHILLTYQCNYECDHCFVWGSPRQTGTFTLAQLEDVFQQALDLGSIENIYFEGGEVFLYHTLLVEAVSRAKALGFWTGIVSNAFWATSLEKANKWLHPLVEAGLDRVELSNDLFHDHHKGPKVDYGVEAGNRLGLSVGTISVDPPTGYRDSSASEPGEPLTGGGVMYRGRAAELLTDGLPRQPWESFTTCPYESLANPGRVHLDPLGNLHLCQGLVMGNLFEQPLKQIVQDYEPTCHPIVGPLLEGGPARLVRRYQLSPQSGYVDACHLCYTARQALRPTFASLLGPDQMYGVPNAVSQNRGAFL
jgi:MoaA/NifB/PqqE/SkfB family radical SAM enzyme